ncbi:MAG: hypothetical protein ACAI25_00325, partial [Planctomycetota bacterium]
ARLTAYLRAGSSVVSFSELRATNAGSFAFDVTAGKLAKQVPLVVSEIPFTGKAAAERRLDTGGDGYAGVDLAARDDQAAVAWTDKRTGVSHVYVATTSNGGKTWRAPVRVDHGKLACRAPSVTVDGSGLVAVAWADADGVHANVSTDGGVNWAPNDSKLDGTSLGGSTGAGKTCKHVRIASSRGRLFVAWSDDRSLILGEQVFVARSLNQGTLWLTERRVDSSLPGAAAWKVSSVNLVAMGETVSVVYVENSQVFAASSQYAGSFFSTPVRLDTPGSKRLGAARLAASGGVLHAAWYDDRKVAGDPTVKTRRSTDGGRTWLPEVSIPIGVKDLRFPIALTLSASGSNVVFVFTGFASKTAKKEVLLVARSTDGGMTFTAVNSAVPKLTTQDPDAPLVAATGKSVVVSWSEDYSGGQRANSSHDGGSTFNAADEKIDDSKATTGSYTGDRLVAVGGGTAYVVWGERRGVNAKAHLYVTPIR